MHINIYVPLLVLSITLCSVKPMIFIQQTVCISRLFHMSCVSCMCSFCWDLLSVVVL